MLILKRGASTEQAQLALLRDEGLEQRQDSPNETSRAYQ